MMLTYLYIWYACMYMWMCVYVCMSGVCRYVYVDVYACVEVYYVCMRACV